MVVVVVVLVFVVFAESGIEEVWGCCVGVVLVVWWLCCGCPSAVVVFLVLVDGRLRGF